MVARRSLDQLRRASVRGRTSRRPSRPSVPSCLSDVLTVLCRFHWRLRSLRHSLEYIIGSDTTQTPAERLVGDPYDGSMVYEVADAPSGLHYPSQRCRGAPGCGSGRGGAISEPADQAHRAVPSRRRYRHRRPRARPEAAREPGPASRDRQSQRRRWHARHWARGQVVSGRLHATAGADQSRHQSEHLCETALRHRAGFLADHDGRFCCNPDGGELARACRNNARLHRGRQGQPARHRQLRLGRRRHCVPPDRRAVQTADRLGAAARALSRWRPDRNRPNRGRDPGRLRDYVGAAAPFPRRHIARASDHEPAA